MLIGAEQYRASDRRSKPDGGQMGASQMGASQMGASQMGASQMGASQMGASQMGASQMGASQMGASQMGASPISTCRDGACPHLACPHVAPCCAHLAPMLPRVAPCCPMLPHVVPIWPPCYPVLSRVIPCCPVLPRVAPIWPPCCLPSCCSIWPDYRLQLHGPRLQLQDDLSLIVWLDIEPVFGAVEAIFARDNRLEADKSVIGRHHRLRPDLHRCQRIDALARQFGNGQGAAMGDLDGNVVRERIRIVGRVGVPLEGRNLKA